MNIQDNHPDIVNQRFQNENSSDDLSEEQLQEYNKKKEVYLQKSIERFHRAKKAFDELVEVEDGYCGLRIEVEAEEELKKNQMTDAEFEYVLLFMHFSFIYFNLYAC